MFGKIILFCIIAHVRCQFYSTPYFQNAQPIIAPVANMPLYGSACPSTLPGTVMVNLPYDNPALAARANIPYDVPVSVMPAGFPAPALVANLPAMPALPATVLAPELAVPGCGNKYLLPETLIPNPRGCFETAVTPCGTVTEYPLAAGNPFLPIASPVSAMAPFSPLLPPASPCGCRCQYLKKIPIPPPCI